MLKEDSIIRERLHTIGSSQDRNMNMVRGESRRTFVGVETSAFSGATLLSFLLNAHPRIASIGEMNGLLRKNPEEYVCSCGNLIRQCEFWQAMRGEMAQCGFDFDVANFATKFHLGGPRWIQRLRADSFHNRLLNALRDAALKSLPGERRRFEKLVARNKAFIESVLRLTGKDVFVDTSKDRMRARALKMFSPYDVRAIHLIRDPRGVVASRLQRHGEISGRRAAYEWVWLHKKLQDFPSFLAPARYMQVRYEDLCSEPRAMLHKLYRFCDVDPDFEPPDFKSTTHHIVGNPMRLNGISVIKLDESWRNKLTPEQQKQVWEIAGDFATKYGYSW